MTYCDHCLSPLGVDRVCHRCALKLAVASPPGVSETQLAEQSAFSSTLPSPEELASQFPHLEIKRLIGHGGMGAIYQARQTSLDRDVAVKIIHREISSNPAFIERFEREARALAKLSHPNIVTIFDFGRTTDGLAFLVMEYIDGINLRQAIDSMPIEPEEAIETVSKTCRALQYAHGKGVVHRDIKPENILLGEDGSVKIADFGIAKIAEPNVRSQITRTRQVLGTPQYLAPEQIESPNEVDHRVDIFSLGVVFYELLTRQLPLGHFDPPSAIDSRIDPRIDAIVLRTLSRKPSQRYQDAQHILDDLAQLRPKTSRMENADSPLAGADNAPIPRYSIPFECQSLGGFGKTRGILHFHRNELRLEYRTLLLEIIKLDLTELRIPIQHLTRLSFKKSNFSNTLVLAVDSLKVLGSFPTSESGVIELKIKSRDREHTEQMIRSVTAMSQSSLKSPIASSGTGRPANLSVAMMLVLLGILNAGVLAIAEVVLANETSGTLHVVLSVAVAVLLGPIALFQIVAGLLHAWLGERSFTAAAASASMLPITPVCLLGIPIGIWALQSLNGGTTVPFFEKQNNTQQPAFGLVTRIFLRESRNARLYSILETTGSIGVIGLVAVFYFGFYPSVLNFRIINESVDAKAMKQSIESRLGTTNTNASVSFPTPSKLYIRAWRFQRESILNQLAIQTSPLLVTLVATNNETDPSTKINVPSDLGNALTQQIESDSSKIENSRKKPVSSAQWQLEKAVKLVPAYVRKLTIVLPEKSIEANRSRLKIEWSDEGRAAFAKVPNGDSTSKLGLLFGSVLEGIVISDSDFVRGIAFQLSLQSSLSDESVSAAIRGPELPSSLELIK